MFVIDAARHAVIEASAGTGKTHTLVELVKELVTERAVPLDQLLLVTYTEKATGELKGRVRGALEDALRDATPQRRALLQAAVDAFDQAHVHTIHGFCQRVLQEYAFDNGGDLRPRLVPDMELYEPCLREIQRKTWHAEFGPHLAGTLELSGYSQGMGGGEAWEQRVLRVALQYRPPCEHKLRPAPVADLAAVLDELITALRTEWNQMRGWAGRPECGKVEAHPWYTGFGRLECRKDWRDARRTKVLLPILQWLADPGAEQRPIDAFRALLAACRQTGAFDKHGFRVLTEQHLCAKVPGQLDQLCPGLVQTVVLLEQRRQKTNWAALQHQLAVQTVQRLQSDLAVYKRERGLVSFEDLLTQVDKALDPARNTGAGAILAALRERYRCAIVDEFQDTDPVQWRIFKRIFVEGGPERRLFVVGDPKQAIFGFRGADVHAYQSATAELRREYGATSYPLTDNWRSCPDLITSLNRLFGDGCWFEGTGIDFTPVKPPEGSPPRFQMLDDQSGRPALTLVDVSAPDTLSAARGLMAGFIAQEIGRLCPGEGAARLRFRDKDERRVLKASDLCVLVARRHEATLVLEALREAHIPYTFYKQAGLWRSDEAIHLGYLLRALVRPNDLQAFRKALLTRFYRFRPEELTRCEMIPSGHEVTELFLSWCGLAERHCWAALARSLLEDTGILFHDRRAADADRRRANLRHILHALEQDAYAQDLDLPGILNLLDARRSRPGDDEADIQPIETEQPRVRVMTIHAAKGLEYPVVFLAGGFTSGKNPDYLTYRDEEQNLVFDLDGSDAAAKEAYQREQESEERRLYYVALTRAIFKLYVPVVDAAKRYRKSGSLVTILRPALQKSGLEALSGSCVRKVDPQDASTEIKPIPAAEPMHRASAAPPPFVPAGELFPAVASDLWRRRIWMRSFSSLHRQGLVLPKGPSYRERPAREDDDAEEPQEAATPFRGPVFGEMLHAILEAVDFDQVGQASSPQELPGAVRLLIDQVRKRYWDKLMVAAADKPALVNACREELARLVWHSLHTYLTEVGAPLCQIPARDRLHELEFCFPEAQGPAPTRMEPGEGFLTGFMDLVFRKDGRYFLLDWKTNQLRGYTPAELAESMRACDYVRQYRLYLLALARWLERFGGGSFDPARDLGGVYYLFVRGLNGKDESSGVFFHQPSAEDLRLERVLGDGRGGQA